MRNEFRNWDTLSADGVYVSWSEELRREKQVMSRSKEISTSEYKTGTTS
jgi:hypothetical protein